MDNLALWQSVEKTDPAHTKPITGKQYKGNSPKPHWIVYKATEKFGPCGIGWGFTIEERIEDGVKDAQGRFDRMSIAKVKVWYIWDGKRGEVEHIGGTPFSGFRKSGDTYIDEDAVKKSVTDALVKALSMIGFAGDIFLGRYDDSKYVDHVGREFAEEDAAKTVREKTLPVMRGAATQGTEALRLAWKALSPQARKAISGDTADLKALADKADADLKKEEVEHAA